MECKGKLHLISSSWVGRLSHFLGPHLVIFARAIKSRTGLHNCRHTEKRAGTIDSQRYVLTRPLDKALDVVACAILGSTLMVWVPFIHMNGHDPGMAAEPLVRRVALN